MQTSFRLLYFSGHTYMQKLIKINDEWQGFSVGLTVEFFTKFTPQERFLVNKGEIKFIGGFIIADIEERFFNKMLKAFNITLYEE